MSIHFCTNKCGRHALFKVKVTLLRGKMGDVLESCLCMECANWLHNIDFGEGG